MDRHPLVIADTAGVIRFWSPGAEATFGHAACDAVGQTLDLIVPPDFRDAHWQGFRRAIAAGAASVENQAAPFPVRHANGDVVETPGRLALVRAPSGEVLGAAVVFAAAEPQGD